MINVSTCSLRWFRILLWAAIFFLASIIILHINILIIVKPKIIKQNRTYNLFWLATDRRTQNTKAYRNTLCNFRHAVHNKIYISSSIFLFFFFCCQVLFAWLEEYWIFCLHPIILYSNQKQFEKFKKMIKERRRKEKKKIEILQAIYVLTLKWDIFVKCIHQFTKIGHLDVFKIKISEV